MTNGVALILIQIRRTIVKWSTSLSGVFYTKQNIFERLQLQPGSYSLVVLTFALLQPVPKPEICVMTSHFFKLWTDSNGIFRKTRAFVSLASCKRTSNLGFVVVQRM